MSTTTTLNAEADLIEPAFDKTREIREIDLSPAKKAMQRLYDESVEVAKNAHGHPGIIESIVSFLEKVIQIMRAIIERILQAFGVAAAPTPANADLSKTEGANADPSKAKSANADLPKTEGAIADLSDALQSIPDTLKVVGRPLDIDAANDKIFNAVNEVATNAGEAVRRGLKQDGEPSSVIMDHFIDLYISNIEKSMQDLQESRNAIDAQVTTVAAQAGVDRSAVIALLQRHHGESANAQDENAPQSLAILDHDGSLASLYSDYMTKMQAHRQLLEVAQNAAHVEAHPQTREQIMAVLNPHIEAFNRFMADGIPNEEGPLADATWADGMPENAFTDFAEKNPFDRIVEKSAQAPGLHERS